MDLKMHEYKKVGLYGGSFDPIHFGHLNLAIQILEARDLDEIWFIPANVNPHKMDTKPSTSEHRLKMLELALSEIPRFGVLDLELKRAGPSYTIDTIQELQQIEKKHEYPSEFSLILGDDTIPSFFNWHQPEEIVKLLPLYIGARYFSETNLDLEGNPLICQAIREGLTPTRIMDVSATDIRERIHKNLYVGHLLPSKVIDYIYDNRLYYKD